MRQETIIATQRLASLTHSFRLLPARPATAQPLASLPPAACLASSAHGREAPNRPKTQKAPRT